MSNPRRKLKVVDVTGRWVPGARLKNMPSAKDAAQEIANLRKSAGRVNAETLLEKAADPDSCLHGMFEWNDDQAAHEFRLTQARLVLRSLVIDTPDGNVGRMLVAVSVGSSGGRDYVPVQQAMKVPEWREEVLEEALRDLRAFRVRYNTYKELAALVASIDRLTVKYERARA